MKRIVLFAAFAALVSVSSLASRAEAAPGHHSGGYHGHGHYAPGHTGFGYYGSLFSFGYQGYAGGYGAPFQYRSLNGPYYPQQQHHHGW